MRCEEIREIVETTTMSLNPEQLADFERHLAGCTPCRQHVEFAHQHKERLASDAEFHPDDEFWRGFNKQVTCEMNRQESFTERFYRWRLQHLPAALCQYSPIGLLKLIIVCLMVLFSILLFRTERHLHAHPGTTAHHTYPQTTTTR